MVEWPDRRPVSAAFLHAEWGKEAPKAGIEGTNPRRWYFPTVDAFSPEGRAMLRKMLIRQAQRAVDAVEMVGGQGVLLWNMEGAYHSTGFVGDPRMLPLMNPEMDEAMDDYYRVIRDAGYRVGMVIRHPQPRWSGGAKEGTWTQGVGNINPNYDYVKDGYTKLLPEHRPWWTVYPIARRLSDKIRYAKRRWDASIFYYDTSLVMYFDWQDRVPEQRRGAATLLAHLATHTGEKAGPAGSDISDAALLDVLIFPEFFERGNPMPGNLAYVAPYGQTGYGRVRPVTGHSQKGTQDFTRDLVPGYFGFHFIHDAGGDASLYRTARINEVVWGEILVTDVGTGPKQRSIREHYLESNDRLGHATAVARHFGLLDRPEKFLPLPYVLEAARRIDVQGLARDPSRQEQLRPHTVSGADRREAALFLAWYGWPYSPPRSTSTPRSRASISWRASATPGTPRPASS